MSSRPLSSYSAKDNEARKKKEEEMGVNGVNVAPVTSLTDTHDRANLPCPPLHRLPRPRLHRQWRTERHTWRSCSCPGPRDVRSLEQICRKASLPPATLLKIGQVDVARTLLLLSSEISLTASVTPSNPVETRCTQAVQATVTEDAPVDSIWWDYLCLRRAATSGTSCNWLTNRFSLI